MPLCAAPFAYTLGPVPCKFKFCSSFPAPPSLTLAMVPPWIISICSLCLCSLSTFPLSGSCGSLPQSGILGYEPLSARLCLVPTTHPARRWQVLPGLLAESAVFLASVSAPSQVHAQPFWERWVLSLGRPNIERTGLERIGSLGYCSDYRHSWRGRGKRSGEMMRSPPVRVEVGTTIWPHLVDRPWGRMDMSSSLSFTTFYVCDLEPVP